MSFSGTSEYVASEQLQMAVNAAVSLQRPLLIKGEPGTGKTMLAEQVAKALDLPLVQWHIKSTTKAQQGLYEYDAVSRLRDSQLGDEKVHDIANYILKGKVWQAFESDSQVVLLIDLSLARTLWRMLVRCCRRAASGDELWPGTGNRETWRRAFFSKESMLLWVMRQHPKLRARYGDQSYFEGFGDFVLIRLGSPSEVAGCLDYVAKQQGRDL